MTLDTTRLEVKGIARDRGAVTKVLRCQALESSLELPLSMRIVRVFCKARKVAQQELSASGLELSDEPRKEAVAAQSRSLAAFMAETND